MNNDITDVAGILVGQAQDEQGLTGCTVVLCTDGATGGVSVMGGAPGTRETDLLRPENLVSKVHAVLLSGGSAFGLNAAAGVMRYLEQKGVGFDAGVARIPIVPAAVIFDLGVGSKSARPDAQMGELACTRASAAKVSQGNFGAGAGATVGKVLGPQFMMKGGVGSASRRLPRGYTVGALAVVNAFGDVYDKPGNIVAGARSPKAGFADTTALITGQLPYVQGLTGIENTTLGVVAIDADLDKSAANKLAQMAQDGLARAIRPVHTMFDGDTVFALATGKKSDAPPVTPQDISLFGIAAAEVMAEAIVNACLEARSVAGIPCHRGVV